MTIHQKVAGAWVERPSLYVRRNNVWTTVTQAWCKVAGVWTICFSLDRTPPPIPALTLDLTPANASGGRWLRVGVNIPGATQITQLRLIRVLITTTEQPSSQYSSTGFVTAVDSDYSSEPWSEYYYNNYVDLKYYKGEFRSGPGAPRQPNEGIVIGEPPPGGLGGGGNPIPVTQTWHPSTSTTYFKQYPVNASGSVKVASDKTYYVTAWSLDFDGNWSAPVEAKLFVPKTGTGGTNTIVKTAHFHANYTGTATPGVGFAQGPLNQNSSPVQQGLWFYGDQWNAIGSSGTPTVKSAQILVNRNDDAGQPVANVYLFRHDYKSPTDVPANGTLTVGEVTLLGTINKGEAKWFTVPAGLVDNLTAHVLTHGFGLYHMKSGGPATAADLSQMSSVTNDNRSGEIWVNWTEAQ